MPSSNDEAAVHEDLQSKRKSGNKKKKSKKAAIQQDIAAWDDEPSADLLVDTTEPATSPPKPLHSFPSLSPEPSPQLVPVEESAEPELDAQIPSDTIDVESTTISEQTIAAIKAATQDYTTKAKAVPRPDVGAVVSPNGSTSPAQLSTTAASSPSPRLRYAQLAGGNTLYPERRPSYGSRKPSSDAYTQRLPQVNHAPPPHLNQQHFARQLSQDYGLTQEETATAGSGHYFCGFDRLSAAVTASGPNTNQTVLLIGGQGSLDVCRVTRNRKDLVGRLEGLRGSVVCAKVLPWIGRDDPFADQRPLIACVVHGPVVDTKNGRADNTDLLDDHEDRSRSRSRATSSDFQTSVEIYSLRASRHVATLYQSPRVSSRYPLDHPRFKSPVPIGSLRLSAEGQYVTVASGVSGEVHIYCPRRHPYNPSEASFSCIGKVWTTVRSSIGATASNDKRDPEDRLTTRSGSEIPIYSLSKRWLVISTPMYSSSQKSLDGTIPLSDSAYGAPGTRAYVSPPPPALDCEVDAPQGNGLLNRVTKQATQEIKRGAQWVGGQGWNVVKSYWGRPNSAEGDGAVHLSLTKQSPDRNTMFPPTHASPEDTPQVVQPSTVSIIDLKKLEEHEHVPVKNPLAPLATFSLNEGVAFLSFAPDGLALLTTNQVGDASHVWDLMRLTDAKTALALPSSSYTAPPNPVGLIRRLAVIPRMSPSVVVDVRWTLQGDRLGILTEKGTVHVHQLPRYDFSATTSKSPAHRPRSGSGLPSPSTSPQDLPASGWIDGMRTGLQTVQDRISAARSRSESEGLANSALQTLGGVSLAARHAGGRVVRNGYNAAVGGAHTLRHAEENKIRVKSAQRSVGPACFHWLTGKDEGLIATVADGRVTVLAVKINMYVQGNKTVISLDASKKAAPDHILAPGSTPTLAPAIAGQLDPSGPFGACAREGVHGFWTLSSQAIAGAGSKVPVKSGAAAATQDKDTSPPYVPLHCYRQFDLLVYDDDKDGKKLSRALGAVETHGDDDQDGVWVFGRALPPATKVNVHREASRDDRKGSGLGPRPGTIDQGGIVEGIVGRMEDDFGIQDEEEDEIVDGSHDTVRHRLG